MAFRLPANIEAVQAILQRQFKSGRSRFTSREHATKVAWRILKIGSKPSLRYCAPAKSQSNRRFYPTRRTRRTAKLFTKRCAKSDLPEC